MGGLRVAVIDINYSLHCKGSFVVQQSEQVLGADQWEYLHALCDSLIVPGTTIPVDADKTLAAALLRRDFDSAKICRAALSIFYSNPKIRLFLDSALSVATATLDSFLADGTLIAFLNTPLMQALLRTSIVPNISFELLLTHIRLRFLEGAVTPNWQSSDEILRAAAALSIYAFLTEYIFAEQEAETGLVETLQNQLEGNSTQPMDLFSIAVLGAYRALASLPLIQGIQSEAASRIHPATVDLIRMQISEPLREQELGKAMPVTTPIEDEVSAKVRAQYEANPYPRWIAHIHNDPVSAPDFFRGACTAVDIDAYGSPETPALLIAGCGTGRVAIEEGLLWADADILAMDLSLTSLAYGQRRAEELGFQHLSFIHGYILQLPAFGKSFDYVTCTGVLHHMADPIAGWQALTNVCRPCGVMRLGLYSSAARALLHYVRTLIDPSRDGADANSIRDGRQSLVERAFSAGVGDERLQLIFSNSDMYAMSTCRDLLFHVHEADFTIPKIASAIERLGLRFCGFVDPTRTLMKKYGAFAPQDLQGLDLASWDLFEAQNSDTFAGMYDFMVQKPL